MISTTHLFILHTAAMQTLLQTVFASVVIKPFTYIKSLNVGCVAVMLFTGPYEVVLSESTCNTCNVFQSETGTLFDPL